MRGPLSNSLLQVGSTQEGMPQALVLPKKQDPLLNFVKGSAMGYAAKKGEKVLNEKVFDPLSEKIKGMIPGQGAASVVPPVPATVPSIPVEGVADTISTDLPVPTESATAGVPVVGSVIGLAQGKDPTQVALSGAATMAGNAVGGPIGGMIAGALANSLMGGGEQQQITPFDEGKNQYTEMWKQVYQGYQKGTTKVVPLY